MKRTFKFFVIALLICAFSCETNQEGINTTEDLLEGAQTLKGGNCMSVVMVEILDCGIYEITSSKDLSNIVYRVGGVDTKIEPLDGKTFQLEISDVTDIWVKSGCNTSGDGPGYGEHFAVDDSEFCDIDPPTGYCSVDADCTSNFCGEGNLCAATVGGRIFLDANGDGIFNPGDSGIVAGVHLQVNVAAGWVDFSFEATDASGFYSFGLLNPSFDYRIRVVAPPGETFTYTIQNVGGDDTIDSDVNAEGISDAVHPGPDGFDTTLWAGVLLEVVDPPFEPCALDSDCANGRCGEGNYCTGSVGGRVFLDANGDGIFNAGDSGTVAGVYLQVLTLNGWQDFGFQATDVEGNYMFGLLTAYQGPGNTSSDFDYRIRLIAPPGAPSFVYTQQNVGSDDSIDSDMNPVDGFSDAVNPDPDEIVNTLWAGILLE